MLREILSLPIDSMPPAEITALQASQAVKDRVADLIYQQKTTGLTVDEAVELNQFMQIEHVMRMAKAQARKRLAGT